MSQTIAEAFIQEGREIGEKQGEKRGEKRGELKTKQEAILKILQFRFDAIPQAVEKKVKSIRNTNRLDALFDKALRARSISEIEMDGEGN